MPWPEIFRSWALVFLMLGIVPAVALLIRVLRFLVLRVRLVIDLGRMGARPLRPLAWLIPWRSACDYRLDLRDPASGAVTHTLAIQLIPTVLGGTEYCLGDIEHWQRQRTVLLSMPRNTLLLPLGYRRLRRRNRERIFRNAPCGAIRVYLFHPHPYALTLSLHSRGRYGSDHGADTLSVPVFREGVLLLDLHSLRGLCADENGSGRKILSEQG